MSAECGKCGMEIVYPPGTWPIGECPVCDRTVPNPGSPEAVEQGCICAVMDNARGAGARFAEDGTPQFWVTQGCPLHSPTSTMDDSLSRLPDSGFEA